MDPISLLQSGTSGAMGRLVDALPVGYAFGAGMMSTVSPCGFTLLPAYLALVLGTQTQEYREQMLGHRLARAVGVAAAMSLGFVLLFGVTGSLIAGGARYLTTALPWISVAIGAGLVMLGAAMLFGGHLSSNILLGMGSRIGARHGGGLPGYFLYGMAFGICSVSCTLPVFLVVVGSAVAAGGLLPGLAQFVAYGLGMAAVVMFVTLVVAFLKEGTARRGTQHIMPYLQPATAIFVAAAGVYILYYWAVKSGLSA